MNLFIYFIDLDWKHIYKRRIFYIEHILDLLMNYLKLIKKYGDW